MIACIYVYPVCVLTAMEVWSYRLLWATTWILGVEPTYSAKALNPYPSLQSSRVTSLILRSSFPLKLHFVVQGEIGEPSFILLHVEIHVSQHHLLNMQSFVSIVYILVSLAKNR